MNCPLCNHSTVKVSWPFTYRRGDKVLFVELKIWECQYECKDFDDGNKNLKFIDTILDKENSIVAKKAWQQAYDEPMPQGRSFK